MPWSSETLLDQTIIHRFDILANGLKQYNNSLRIPGSLHSSLSLSEYEGYLRVATTTTMNQRRDWFEKAYQENNYLFIMGNKDGHFELISSLENIAPGKKIWSAQFSKDKAFLSDYFTQPGSIFTLDLKNPLAPKVAGMFKIDKAFTYLQGIGNDILLAVGYGGNNEEEWQISASLFDINNFAKATLLDNTPILEKLIKYWFGKTNYLAINYFAATHITAIPLTYKSIIVDNSIYPLGYRYINKLRLIHTEADKPMSVIGDIDHSRFLYNKTSHHDEVSPAIRRSYIFYNFIYAISSKAVTSTRLSDMKEMAAIELP